METQSNETLADYADPAGAFGREVAKVRFNAAAALEQFTSSTTKWECYLWLWFSPVALEPAQPL